MKRKVLAAFLVAVLTAGSFTGCGNKIEGDGKVQAATAEDGSSQGEDNGSSESEAPESEPEATAEPTKEPSSEPTAIPESSTAPEASDASENNEGEEEKKDAIEAGLGAASAYTFTQMDNVVMYAKSGVNVRDLPGTDGKQISKLSAGEEVTVTGQCVETGWYRIVMNNSDAYVSDSYIVSEKPSVQTTNRGGSSASDEIERNNVLAAIGEGSQGTGQEQAEISVQGANQSQDQEQQGQSTSTSNEVSTAFVDYLNQQRAAAGLSTVAWDSGLAEAAKVRAVEISTDFNHDDATDRLENILGNPSSSVAAWYEQWYNSEGHRLTMMNPNLTSVAAAYYEVDDYYWVVFLAYCEVPVLSAEEWNAAKENGEYREIYKDESTGVTVYGNEGVEVETDEQIIEDMDAVLRETGLIP